MHALQVLQHKKHLPTTLMKTKHEGKGRPCADQRREAAKAEEDEEAESKCSYTTQAIVLPDLHPQPRSPYRIN